MRATFIDCYVKADDIILWIKIDDKNLRLVDSFVPYLYLKTNDLKSLRDKLRKQGIVSSIKKKKSFFNALDVNVLAVPVYKLSQYHDLIKYIETIEKYDIEVYNADIKLEELYMFEREIFPTSIVDVVYERDRIISIKSIDDPDSIDYIIPKFKESRLDISTVESLEKSFDTTLTEITYNNKRFSGNEKEILKNLKSSFNEDDPDIIWTKSGNLIIPYLKERLELHGIDFNFNRFEKDNFKFKEGESYWAYTNIIYRHSSIFLKGRLHFDSQSFFADDTGFYGIIDASRICKQRIQRTEMRSAGAAVTNLLLFESFKKGFLLPYKIGMYERFKTLGQLYECDRGSMIFEPKIGFHTDVAELDFISLYPQIMWKKNLSPENLFCRCCKNDEYARILHYHFCRKRKGIVSIVAEKLIKRRIQLKKEGSIVSKEKAVYLKWLLVTMFGYQAFKNRKIGTIEIHESIQAYARDIIMQSVHIAESLGWEVIHGIVDSIYVKKKDFNDNDISKLKQEIIKKTGFEIAHEGNYRWIVFLPSIIDDCQPISNHFFGLLKKKDLYEIKCRGIEARRKDFPKIISDMQSEMILEFSDSFDIKTFKNHIPNIYSILKKYIKILDHADSSSLAIRKRLSKLEYDNNIPQKILIHAMQETGWQPHPGQTLDFIILDSQNKIPSKRYIFADEFKGKFDKKKYIQMMVRATFNILQPFGISMEEVMNNAKNSRQLKLFT